MLKEDTGERNVNYIRSADNMLVLEEDMKEYKMKINIVKSEVMDLMTLRT